MEDLSVAFENAEIRITSYNVCYTKLLREGQRRIGEQSDPLAIGDLGQPVFVGAVEQVVGILDRGDPRQSYNFV